MNLKSWKQVTAIRGVARAAALVAMLLGVGAVPSQAEPIEFSPDDPVNDFVFNAGEVDLLVFRIGFDQVLTTFTLDVAANLVDSEDVDNPFAEEGFQCVEMAGGVSSPQCVEFVVSGPEGLPTSEGDDPDFLGGPGAINIGVLYGIFGFPLGDDPVDLGETDNFSTFMVFARNTKVIIEGEEFVRTEFLLAHKPSDGDTFEDISFAHCNLNSIDACATREGFLFTLPEPATMLLLGPGLLGLAVLRRRQTHHVERVAELR